MGEILKKRLKQQKFSSVEQELVLSPLIAANYIRSKIDSLCIRFNITHAQFNVLRILKGASPEGYPRGGITQRMVEPAPWRARPFHSRFRPDCLPDAVQYVSSLHGR